MKLEQKRTGQKHNPKSQFSRRVFSLCFFRKEGVLGHPENNCTKPGISPLLSYMEGQLGNHARNCIKFSEMWGVFPSPPPPHLNNLPFCSAAMNANKVIPVCFPMVFKSKCQIFISKT